MRSLFSLLVSLAVIVPSLSIAEPKDEGKSKICPSLKLDKMFSFSIRTTAKKYDEGFKEHAAKIKKLEKMLPKFTECTNRFSKSSSVMVIDCYKDPKTDKYTNKYTSDTCMKYDGTYLQFTHYYGLLSAEDMAQEKIDGFMAKLFNEEILYDVNETENVKY